MLFRTQSAAVYGIDANLVDVEVDLTPVRNEADVPSSVIIVGLPDLAVRESRERIRAAINNSAFFFPFHKTTINLAPADVRKEGASFDLPATPNTSLTFFPSASCRSMVACGQFGARCPSLCARASRKRSIYCCRTKTRKRPRSLPVSMFMQSLISGTPWK